MAKRARSGPAWMPTFLAALAETRIVLRAVEAAGVTGNAAYYQRRTRRDFADAWDAALKPAPPADNTMSAPSPDGPVPPDTAARSPGWKTRFFEALAETSSVTVSAARANVPVSTINSLKREDAAFAAKWLAALHEGYDHLEMELLGYLRDPSPRRKMDVTGALRLLAAHRATVERRRALEDEEDEQAVRESLDAFLEGLRQRRLANQAILAEADSNDVAE